MLLDEQKKIELTTTIKKEWQKLLIDENISEREVFKRLGLTQQIWNKKLKDGTIKHYEMLYLLEYLGYKIDIIKK